MKKIKQPNYFVWDKVSKEAIIASVKDVITQSEIMMRASCPRKWFYKYALKLDRRAGISRPLVYGQLVHEGLAELYNSGHYGETPKEYPIEIRPIKLPDDMLLMPGDADELELVRQLAQITFDNYRWYYHKLDSKIRVRKVEETFETKFRGVKLSGRIDLVAHPNLRNGIYIWDFKTAGRFDAAMLDAWSFRFQFLYYAWLYWRCTGERPSGNVTNGLRKSRLRPKETKHETKKEYIDRVKENYKGERSKFFYRQRMPLIKGALERFEKDILEPHITAFRLMGIEDKEGIGCELAHGMLGMALNTSQCHLYNSFCEYLPLCQHGSIMLPEFVKRDFKHRELENEQEIGEE